MINQLKKSCYEMIFSIGGYPPPERGFEKKQKKENKNKLS